MKTLAVFIVVLLYSVTPVSYTHLDVYKRQALYSTPAGKNTIVIVLADHGDGMGSHRMVTKQVSFYEEMTNAVSYTHLDVYKRQMYNIIQLNDKNLSELQTIAQELSIKKTDSLKKEELVYKILDEQAIAGATKKVAADKLRCV